MRTIIASVILASGLTASAVTMSHATTPSPAHGHLLWEQRTPCADEGSNNCYWNADTMGNGGGHSYVVRTIPGSRGITCVLYVKRADRHMDYCS